MMTPRVLVQTTEDEDGNVSARTWIYEWDADGDVPAYRDALNVLDGEWEHVSKAQRLNEMNARYQRYVDLVMNPVQPDPPDRDAVLIQAQQALTDSLQAIQQVLDAPTEQPTPEAG